MSGRLTQNEERSAKIGRDHSVEHVQIAIGDLAHRHHSGRMHNHVDCSKLVERGFEEQLDLRRSAHVCLYGNGSSGRWV
jgi:hypothetical protein